MAIGGNGGSKFTLDRKTVIPVPAKHTMTSMPPPDALAAIAAAPEVFKQIWPAPPLDIDDLKKCIDHSIPVNRCPDCSGPYLKLLGQYCWWYNASRSSTKKKS